MKRKYNSIWIVLSLTMIIAVCPLVITISSVRASATETTSRPGEFLNVLFVRDDHLTNTLIILDIDDTTITSPDGQWLGRSDMFYDLLTQQQKMSPNSSRAELSERIDPLLVAVYHRVPVVLTDPELPGIIATLKKQGSTVIGMTARGKKVREVTLKQLEATGIEFSDIGESRWLELEGERQVRIERGVVFVSHGNKKGETLLALLKEGRVKVPHHTVLIDDRLRHLDDVEASLSEWPQSIKYTPVLCTYLKDKPPYDSVEAERQLMELILTQKNDPVFDRLIREDDFTRQFIRRCPEIMPKHRSQCSDLKDQAGR